MDKDLALRMKRNGMTYQQIGDYFKVSRQRVQQAISPPFAVKLALIRRSGNKCQDCGIFLGGHGDIHHEGGSDCDYNDIDNLVHLCTSCHVRRHGS